MSRQYNPYLLPIQPLSSPQISCIFFQNHFNLLPIILLSFIKTLSILHQNPFNPSSKLFQSFIKILSIFHQKPFDPFLIFLPYYPSILVFIYLIFLLFFSYFLLFQNFIVHLHSHFLQKCPDGGIGRRAGLKHQWSNPSRFEPESGYEVKS